MRASANRSMHSGIFRQIYYIYKMTLAMLMALLTDVSFRRKNKWTPVQTIFISTVGLVFLIYILELIRKHRMGEEYALIWIVIALLFLTIPLVVRPAPCNRRDNRYHRPQFLLFFSGP